MPKCCVTQQSNIISQLRINTLNWGKNNNNKMQNYLRYKWNYKIILLYMKVNN